MERKKGVRTVTTTKLNRNDGDSSESLLSDSEFDVAILEREDVGPFGWGRIQFSCMQGCKNQWWFLCCLCLLSISYTAFIYGIVPAYIPELEHRLAIGTKHFAFIRFFHEIGFLLALIPYLIITVRGTHRPQWIGVGGLYMASGMIMCSMAHFWVMAPDELHMAMKTPYCRETTETDMDSECEHRTERRMVMFVMCFGYFLLGVGAAPISVLGMAYLDETVTRTKSALLTGIFGASELLGPALGVTLAMAFNRIPGDLGMETGNTKDAKKYDVHNPHWYPAWWMAVFVVATVSVIASVWIFAFPEELQGAHIAATRNAIAAQKEKKKRRRLDEERKEEKKRTRKAILGVLKNKPFWGLAIEKCCRMALLEGFVVFMPKYLHSMFDMQLNRIFIGSVAIFVSAIMGLFFGTSFQHTMRLKLAGTIRLALFAAVAGTVFAMCFLVRCPTKPFAGITIKYPASPGYPEETDITLKAHCNSACNCTDAHFDPVCVHNGVGFVTYYSLCHAGCHSENETIGTNCECIKDSLELIKSHRLFNGKECNICTRGKKAAFMIGLSWTIVAAYLRKNAIQQAILRCVPFRSRILALTISEITMRACATIPGTYVVARMLLDACSYTQKSCATGECIWYNKETLSRYMLIFAVGLSAVTVVGLLIALATYEKEKSPDTAGTSKKSSGSLSASSSSSMKSFESRYD